MWELKSIDVSRKTELEKNEPLGHLTMLVLSFVLTNGIDEIGLTTLVEDDKVARRTVKAQLNKLNAQETFIEEVKGGTFSLEEATPTLSRKERKAQKLAAKEREIEEEMERIDREERIAARAEKSAALAAKVAERDAILTEPE